MTIGEAALIRELDAAFAHRTRPSSIIDKSRGTVDDEDVAVFSGTDALKIDILDDDAEISTSLSYLNKEAFSYFLYGIINSSIRHRVVWGDAIDVLVWKLAGAFEKSKSRQSWSELFEMHWGGLTEAELLTVSHWLDWVKARRAKEEKDASVSELPLLDEAQVSIAYLRERAGQRQSGSVD